MRSPGPEQEPKIVRVVDRRPSVSKPEPKIVRVVERETAEGKAN